jgi:hypothetical protein
MFILFSFFVLGWINDQSSAQRAVIDNHTLNFFCDFYIGIDVAPAKDFYFGNDNIPLWLKNYTPIVYTSFYYISKIISGEPAVIQYGIISFIVCIWFIIFAIQLFDLKTGKTHIRFLTILALMFSSIAIFTYEKGNTVILSATAITFFVVNYKSQSKVFRELAYICLALAAAIKVSPAIFGLLLLYDKQYKESIRAALYFFILFFLPFFFAVTPEHGFIDNIVFFIKQIIIPYSGGMHSFPANIGINLFTDEIRNTINAFISVFIYVSSLFVVITTPFLKDEWKKVLSIFCVLILLSGTAAAAQYPFIFILPFVVMFLNSESEINFSNTIYFFAFLLILSPLQFGKIHNITISWTIVKIGFWIMFFHLIYDSAISFMQNRKNINLRKIISPRQ